MLKISERRSGERSESIIWRGSVSGRETRIGHGGELLEERGRC